MNKVILTGRLVRDPELNTLPNSDKMVCKFALAVDRRVKQGEEKKADFIRCVAWGKTAETIANYLGKGRKILVSGRIQTGNYEKDGEKRYTTDIIVDEFEFLDKKDNQQEQSGGYNGDSDMIPVDDGEIPF